MNSNGKTTEQNKMELKLIGKYWTLIVNGKALATFKSLTDAVKLAPEAMVTT